MAAAVDTAPAGMLETTRIRKEGFSHRPTFADFINRYKVIAFPLMSLPPATGEVCERILNRADIKGYLIGKSKVGPVPIHQRPA